MTATPCISICTITATHSALRAYSQAVVRSAGQSTPTSNKGPAAKLSRWQRAVQPLGLAASGPPAKNKPSIIVQTINGRPVTDNGRRVTDKRGLGKTAKFSWENNYGTTSPSLRTEDRGRDDGWRTD
jgi:hypothetical protein